MVEHSYVLNKPTPIVYQRLRILILDAPTNANLHLYVNEMKEFGVAVLVRTCESNYNHNLVLENDISVRDLFFNDGDPPPPEVVTDWLLLVQKSLETNTAIAVHCVAGLGRAPVLACIALVEYGMQPLDAIYFVRERRKGAINRRQLEYLKMYKKQRRRTAKCLGCSSM
ncbi:protein tyrosine phosphatase [Theileria orientalis strain Shintoku]|uniref:protein-tyrosine-phosphatase n=1 Tax=Theileria orientalis strain Shintoku TaxID=869250 RepID=J4D6K2_THEOR|nr:protein tyrosine phosphatase [Theileria orientalis strain Shintoku]PVC49597.1 protein tyrosine phosphatase [Theileria orientalis]BAM39630.1 protein tyrosine phosphatase [Theileria orientalis strain Shintoku]|eukprot:XP_009689931.1 protein tyrosine phosphatase [Theileria orientalis strain Shintoku]